MQSSFDLLSDPAVRLTIGATALGFMLLEYLASRWSRRGATHDLGECAASIAVSLGHNLVRVGEAAVLAVPFALVYEHRLLDVDLATPLAFGLLVLLTDLTFYCQHRAMHRIRLMWATHAVHHTPTRINLTTGVRLGWTNLASGIYLFYLPLVWIGYHPAAVLGMLILNNLYQFFLHTELAPRFGPLEWVFNTPSHHLVHHAMNPSCLDKNYGGILIVFDRLFGTFAAAPRDEPLRYGLIGAAPTLNPLRIAFCEWIALVRDVRRAGSFGARLRILAGPPGAKR